MKPYLFLPWLLSVFAVAGCGSAEFGGTGASLSKKLGASAPANGDAGKPGSGNAQPAGAGGAGTAPDQTYAMVVADDGAAPACTTATEGKLVYVLATTTFETCHAGAWVPINIAGAKGDKGDKGDPGAASSLGSDAALAVYKASRRSVFRVTVACGGKTPSMQWGSGFRCSATQICTNAHVITCAAAAPITLFKLEEVQPTVDTTGDLKGAAADDGAAHPGFFSTATPTIKTHPTRDLAKIDATGFSADSAVLKLPAKDYTNNETPLAEILSMSFPLAFEDLYTGTGNVITPYIGDCNATGVNTSKYGCVRQSYDFATTNQTDHGSSGSPLFNVTTGEVIGVTSAGPDQENANYTWAIDAFEFSKF